MLHMIVNTHHAESCAFRSDSDRERLLGALGAIESAATAHNATLQGAWANRAAHTVFALIDAPDAHTVDDVISDAGLNGVTESHVYAVSPLDQVAASIPGAD